MAGLVSIHDLAAILGIPASRVAYEISRHPGLVILDWRRHERGRPSPLYDREQAIALFPPEELEGPVREDSPASRGVTVAAWLRQQRRRQCGLFGHERTGPHGDCSWCGEENA